MLLFVCYLSFDICFFYLGGWVEELLSLNGYVVQERDRQEHFRKEWVILLTHALCLDSSNTYT